MCLLGPQVLDATGTYRFCVSGTFTRSGQFPLGLTRHKAAVTNAGICMRHVPDLGAVHVRPCMCLQVHVRVQVELKGFRMRTVSSSAMHSSPR